MRFNKNIIKDESVYLDFEKENLSASDFLGGENMILCETGFKTRPAISLAREESVFDLDEFSETAKFHLTDFFLSIDEKTAQLAVVIESDNKSYIYYRFLAIFADGSHRSLGYIPFNRASLDSFSHPYSYVIYSGKKTIGGGIYFLARLGGSAPSKDFRIYEIAEDFNSWKLLADSEFYIPTVLSNGRGDRANMAIALSDINLSKPKILEAQNLLTGCFDCYYTSDGYSNSFTLPKLEKRPLGIVCTLTTETGTVYTWDLNQENYYTTSANIIGNGVIAKYRPELNQVFFYNPDYTPLAPLYYGLENNLRFSVKDSNTQWQHVASVTKACNILGNNKKGCSAVTVFSGSYHNSKEALWINPDRPLYFPSICICALSDSEGDEETMVALNGNVIFLKNKSASSFKITAAEHYDIENIIHGVENADAVSYPTLVLQRKLSLPEKINISSVTRSGNEIWFCSDSGNIFKIDSSLSFKKYFSEISEKPVCAAISDRCYLAICGKSCLVFDVGNAENSVVFNWKFPVEIIASTDFGSETIFFAKDRNDSVWVYRLGGDADRYFIEKNYILTEKITSSLSLRILKSVNKKRLYSIFINTTLSENSIAEIFDDNKKIGHHIIYDGKNILKRPAFFENLSVKFTFKDTATLLGAGIKYSKLSKIRR